MFEANITWCMYNGESLGTVKEHQALPPPGNLLLTVLKQ